MTPIPEQLVERLESALSPVGYSQPRRKTDRLLLTEIEAAEILGLSRSHLAKLRKSGSIGCVQLGRLIRYAPDQLTDWIARHRKEPCETSNDDSWDVIDLS